VKTLDKDLIAIEEDFKGRFSLFNFKIWIWNYFYPRYCKYATLLGYDAPWKW
jgi:hypothetical protein